MTKNEKETTDIDSDMMRRLDSCVIDLQGTFLDNYKRLVAVSFEIGSRLADLRSELYDYAIDRATEAKGRRDYETAMAESKKAGNWAGMIHQMKEARRIFEESQELDKRREAHSMEDLRD